MSEWISQACGHARSFTPRGDGYDDARRAKVAGKSCPDCAKLKHEADILRQKTFGKTGKVKRGQELKVLPVGSHILLIKAPDGTWLATARSGTVMVQAVGAGSMGVINKVARKLLVAMGTDVQGGVKE